MTIKKFYSSTCELCKQVDKFFESHGITDYENINVGEEQEKAIEYMVMSVPTVVITDNESNEFEKYIGMKEIIENMR